MIIHKYTIDARSSGVDVSVEMPKGARILHVAGQRENLCIWALVDTDHLGELHHFRVYPTGAALPEDFKEGPSFTEDGDRYIGTAHCGPFVWHVFERSA